MRSAGIEVYGSVSVMGAIYICVYYKYDCDD